MYFILEKYLTLKKKLPQIFVFKSIYLMNLDNLYFVIRKLICTSKIVHNKNSLCLFKNKYIFNKKIFNIINHK